MIIIAISKVYKNWVLRLWKKSKQNGQNWSEIIIHKYFRYNLKELIWFIVPYSKSIAWPHLLHFLWNWKTIFEKNTCELYWIELNLFERSFCPTLYESKMSLQVIFCKKGDSWSRVTNDFHEVFNELMIFKIKFCLGLINTLVTKYLLSKWK